MTNELTGHGTAFTLSGEQLTAAAVTQLATEAAERVYEHLDATPVYRSTLLGTDRSQLLIKDESVQPNHSFKDRGAANAVSILAESGCEEVFTSSAGNHGLGIARAGLAFDMAPTIVVPRTASDEKKAALRRYGVHLVTQGADFEEALDEGLTLSRIAKGAFIHPFADMRVISGQATLGLELVEQVPDMTHLVLPVGGGGLLAGVASVVKQRLRSVQIVAAQAEGCEAFTRSLKAGRPVQRESANSLFEGVAVRSIHPLTYAIGRRVVDKSVVVTTEEVDKAIYLHHQSHDSPSGRLLERAGGVSLAAAAQIAAESRLDRAKIVAVASGANPPGIYRHYLETKARNLGW
jgi:threonine dehydratase